MGDKRWFNPVDRVGIEKYLDARCLYVAMGNGRWWLARRNGATKLWKRDIGRFRIPVKFGFKGTAAIEQNTDLTLLRVAGSRDDAEGTNK